MSTPSAPEPRRQFLAVPDLVAEDWVVFRFIYLSRESRSCHSTREIYTNNKVGRTISLKISKEPKTQKVTSSHHFTQTPRREQHIMLPTDQVQALATFAAAFGSAVVIETDKTSWVARKGPFCVFEVLRRVSPQV